MGGTLALTGAGALNSASVQFGLGSVAGTAGTHVFDISGATDTDLTDGSPTPWRSLAGLTTAASFTLAHEVRLGATALAPVDLRVISGTFGNTAGFISGFGKLVKVSAGGTTLTLQSANTLTGSVEIWGGTLALSADNQLGTAPTASPSRAAF